MTTSDRLSGQGAELDQRLNFLLEQLALTISADDVCLFYYHDASDSPSLLIQNGAKPLPGPLVDRLQKLVESLQIDDEAYIVRISQGASAEDADCGLIAPLPMHDALIGAVVGLSHRDNGFGQDDIVRAAPLIELIQTVLENRLLSQRLITTEALAQTSQAILQNPSPQNVVDILRDYLFDSHVVSCTLAFYAPPPSDSSENIFLDIKGAWSRTSASGPGVGVRFAIGDDLEFFTRLHKERFLSFTDRAPLRDVLPSLADVFTGADSVDMTTLLALQANDQWLGALAISVDARQTLSFQELRVYQIIGEFLAATAMYAELQRKANFVQQSRAAVLDAVTDGVVMVVPDESCTILTMNRQFTAMFGVLEEQAVGKSLWDLLDMLRIPASLRTELRQTWQAAIDAGEDFILGEFQMIGVYGDQFDIQWYTNPVFQDDELIGRIFTFYDMTPERTTERLKNELLSRLSHELRTP